MFRPGNWSNETYGTPSEQVGRRLLERLLEETVGTPIGDYTYTQIFSGITCYFGLFLVFLELLLAVYIARATRESLERPWFIKQFGYFYDTLKIGSWTSKIFNLTYILRRVFQSFIYMFMNQYPAQQIQLTLLINLGFCIYVGNCRPFILLAQNKTEFVNESLILMITVNLCVFTDFC